MDGAAVSINWPLLTATEELRQQQPVVLHFRMQRRLLDAALAQCAVRPPSETLQLVVQTIQSSCAFLPLEPDEKERVSFWAQKRKAALEAGDPDASSVALTGYALYAPLTSLEPQICAQELAPWWPQVLSSALGLRLVSFDSTEQERLAAMNWCLELAAEIVRGRREGRLPEGERFWPSWLHALAFSSSFVPFHAGRFNIKPFASLFGALRREAYETLAKPAQRNFDLYGALSGQAKKDGRIRIGLLTTAPHMHAHGLPDFIWWLALLDRKVFEPVLILGGTPAAGSSLASFLDDHLDALLRYAPVVVVGEGAYERLGEIELDLVYNFCGFPWGHGDRMGHVRIAQSHMTAFYTPATTGCTEIDYYLTSPELDPLAEEAFTETPVMVEGMPFCFHYASYFNGMPERAARPAGVAPDAVIYTLGPAVIKKLTRDFMDALIAILQRVPKAVVVMMPGLPVEKRVHLTAFLVREAERVGLDPDRFFSYPFCKRAELYAMLAGSDVFLDFFPFSGTNNIMDPVSVGVPPVVCMPQSGFSRNRIGGVLMQQIGLEELVASDAAEFVDIAVRLGQDVAWRERLRERLGRSALRKTTLFDGVDFMRRVFGVLCAAAGRRDCQGFSMPLQREAVEAQIDRDFARFLSDQRSHT